MKIGEEVRNAVSSLKHFDRDVIGKQLVRAVDSIAANLSEGLGRLQRAHSRRLISDECHDSFKSDLDKLARMLNTHINSLNKTLTLTPGTYRTQYLVPKTKDQVPKT
jgi:hypothetical protein